MFLGCQNDYLFGTKNLHVRLVLFILVSSQRTQLKIVFVKGKHCGHHISCDTG